jgi:hypothetical protein
MRAYHGIPGMATKLLLFCITLYACNFNIHYRLAYNVLGINVIDEKGEIIDSFHYRDPFLYEMRDYIGPVSMETQKKYDRKKVCFLDSVINNCPAYRFHIEHSYDIAKLNNYFSKYLHIKYNQLKTDSVYSYVVNTLIYSQTKSFIRDSNQIVFKGSSRWDSLAKSYQHCEEQIQGKNAGNYSYMESIDNCILPRQIKTFHYIEKNIKNDKYNIVVALKGGLYADRFFLFRITEGKHNELVLYKILLNPSVYNFTLLRW